MKLFLVPDDIQSMRIDKYLIDNLEYSRSKIQKLINSGAILVNDNKVKNSYLVKADDEIKFIGDIDDSLDIIPENIELDIIYEDDYLLVVNKPVGMVVHPSIGHRSHTLVNALLYHCNNLSNVNGSVRPGIVHRIDKDTSGLLLVAKNDEVHQVLADELKERKIARKYIALVHGVINHDKGTIDAPIGRDASDRKKMAITENNSKDAITHFVVLERFKNATLIECKLETGRTHQIRIHMQYIGYPIINDPVYGFKKIIDSSGQMLHAKSLSFYHPITGQYMEFEAPVPESFQKIVEKYKS